MKQRRIVLIAIICFFTSVTVTLGILFNKEISLWTKTNLLKANEAPSQETIDPGINPKEAFEIDQSTENLTAYVLSLMQNKDTVAALTVLETSQNTSQELSFYHGVILSLNGKNEEAKEYFKKALLINGSIDIAIIQNFINAYTDFETEQDGQSIYLNALLTKAYIDASLYQTAEEMAIKILNEKSDYRDVWIMLGYSYIQMEKYVDAEDAFIKAKSVDSVKPEVHYFLGLSRYMQENWSGAIDEFELAILYGFEPKAEAYKKIAESQNVLGRFEESLAAYEYMLNAEQSSVDLFREPIRIAMENIKDFDRALTLANLATTTFPSEAESWNLTAKVYLARGEISSSENAIETAIDLNRMYAENYFVKGMIDEANGNTDAAKASYKSAYELSLDQDDVHTKSAEKYNELMLKKQ